LRCSVILPFRDARTASAVLGSVTPERDSGGSRRNRVNIFQNGTDINLEITSEDITSMRAAVNSYLRWFILAKRITEISGDD
jgi:tRNA threonylcarbamoyladenosine modification (KEOPS) complex  Pcc1 subunit